MPTLRILSAYEVEVVADDDKSRLQDMRPHLDTNLLKVFFDIIVIYETAVATTISSNN